MNRSIRMKTIRLILIACLILMFALAPAAMQPTWAADTIAVTETLDDDPGVNNGFCSLREAVIATNTNTTVDSCVHDGTAGMDTITLPAGTYTLTRIGSNEDAALTGDLDVIESLMINGADAGTTFIDGNSTDRIIDISTGDGAGVEARSGVNLTLTNITLQNGAAQGEIFNSGGAVDFRSDGTLTLTDVTVTGNKTATASGTGGGVNALTASGVTISGSTFSNNDSNPGSGGGFYCVQCEGIISITDTIFSGNTSTFGGGGALVIAGNLTGTVTLTDVEITNNKADVHGGGILIDAGTGTWTRLNVNGNEADMDGGGVGDGGGIGFAGGNYTLVDSSITGNSTSAPAFSHGGGIAIDSQLLPSGNTALSVSINNTTISGNDAGSGEGGGVYVDSDAPGLTHVTIADNTAGIGANLAQSGGILTVTNSIIANPNTGNNCSGTITEAGRNLVFGAAGTCGGSITTDPMLVALALDGATNTYYHDLGVTSNAIDQADNGSCTADDQIGILRGIDGNGTANDPQFGDCDLGAIEIVNAIPYIAKVFNPATIVSGKVSTLTFTILNPNAFDLSGLTFIDNFPGDMTLVSMDSNGCGFTFTSGDLPGDTTIDVNSGTVGANSSCTLVITVTATILGTHTNTTGIIDALETIDEVDTASADLTVKKPKTSAPPSGNIETSDPAISKSGSPLNATVGEEVVWTIWVTNPGSTATDFVFVNDPIPAMFDITNVTTTQGMANTNGQVVTVDVGTVQPGETITIQIFTVANDLAQPGEVCNTATITGGEATACVNIFPSELPPTGGEPIMKLWLAGVAAMLALGLGGGVFALRRKAVKS